MVDFHSHVLPCVDDGSKSVEESIAMLSMLKAQGADKVVATPHFYAENDSPADFFSRRNNAMKTLVEAYPEADDMVVLGAEVEYYYGVSRMKELLDMRFQGTDILLLEMPVAPWSEYIVKEVLELASCGGIRLALAHVERYMDLQPKKVWKKLLAADILMQVNASFFISPSTSRHALKLLKKGEIDVIGSDCHGSQYRAPRLSDAYSVIEKKLGANAVRSLHAFSDKLLK